MNATAQTNETTTTAQPETTFDKVLTNKHVYQARIENYVSRPAGKKGADYNTSMQDNRTGNIYEFDIKVDFSGMLLRDALDKAAVDIKTDIMNNLRPKYPDKNGAGGDSDSVRAAKLARLDQVDQSGELVVKATAGGRGLYQVTDEVAIQHLASKDKDRALAAYNALREALIAQGIDPAVLDATTTTE